MPPAMEYQATHGPIIRAAALVYAAFAFLMTFAFFTRYVIFLGNLPKPSKPWVSPAVDIGATVDPYLAGLSDLALIALFGLQHSLMARPSFKDLWTRIVPEGLERSTYVLAACLVGFIMLLFWQPVPIVIWQASATAATAFWVLFAVGWLILLTAAINFDIFELLGLRQAWAWTNGQPRPMPNLKQGGLYRLMRHPMYVGVLLGLWMTPFMTVGHALMAAGFTFYILIAMRFEERDLRRTFGAAYEASRAKTARPHS